VGGPAATAIAGDQPSFAVDGTAPFAASSPWNAPLHTNAPLDPHSAAIVSDLNGQIARFYGRVSLNTTSYSAPIYTVGRNQPTVNMSWHNCEHKTWLNPTFAADLRNVPIPAGAVPSEGTDGEMVVWQPSTDTDWEFWKASDARGRWSACWGGEIQDVSHNLGTFAGNTGATASGLPLLGGLIRLSDLASGAIDHAISLNVPDARAKTFSWPAARTDGRGSSPDDPAEGERFRLPASLDLQTLDLSPGELMIAQAMKRYGVIVTDQSGSVAIQGEDSRPYAGTGTPTYSAYFTGPEDEWLVGLPWSDLQAVAWDHGEPSS
jgi:hypothetical protein